MIIKIVGAIGPMHSQLKENVEDILHETGLKCELDIIHNIEEIIKIEEEELILTPALIINEKIITQGHIWSKDHIKAFLLEECKSENKLSEPTDKFSKWKGVPREKIDWHPIIDETKCTGCGMCVTSCGRKVFDYDHGKNKSVVARPLQCMVGCTSCQVWCTFDAISFPDKKVVRDFIKENKILENVKKQLNKEV